MNPIKDIVEACLEEDEFNHREQLTSALAVVHGSVLRKEWKDAAKYALIVAWLGVELEDLGLTDYEMNNLGMFL